MTLQEILASLLNPGGSQQANQLSMAGAPPAVGDHNNPAMMFGGQMGQAQPQMPAQAPQQPMAPPQAPQGQPMPQGAPMASPAGSANPLRFRLAALAASCPICSTHRMPARTRPLPGSRSRAWTRAPPRCSHRASLRCSSTFSSARREEADRDRWPAGRPDRLPRHCGLQRKEVQQAPGGGGTQPVVPGAQPDQGGGNIPITGPKYSEDMRKSLGFANKAEQADAILVKPNVEAAAESGWENFKAGVPLIHNKIVSNDYQSFDQAQRNFINSVLRRESGAAISESEFDNARRQYLPQWGDSPELIQQKADNRRTAIEGLHQSGDAVPSMSGGSMGGGTVPAPDQILQMPKDQLDKLIPNIKTMTPEQRKAAERRWDELNK
jgi:hypothetical protein